MMHRTTYITAVSLVVLALIPATAQAQAFKCSFPQASGAPFDLVYAGIDAGRGHAQLIGNAGTSDVLMRSGTTAISFLEVVGSGAVMTTTIAIVAASPFDAVHSRNTLMGGTFVPTQMTGECAFLD